jgi:AraC-like DNA-binding protein
MIRSATGIREIIEMTAGVIALNLRAIIGAGWNPQLVCFRHTPPATTRFHRDAFRCPVRFATDVDGLVCRAGDFGRRNQLVGQGSVDFVRHALTRATRTTGDPMLRLTQRFIWALLPSGNCTAENVARLLGVDRRTLHRRLSRHGETFTTLLDAVRIELATRHVGLGLRRLADVAGLLGFRSQSDFSHWFVRQFGMSPSQWRKRIIPADDQLRTR